MAEDEAINRPTAGASTSDSSSHNRAGMESSVPEILRNRSDAELMSLHLRGDDAAFSELYHRHGERLYLYAARFLANPRAAEDMTQQMWENIILLRQKNGHRSSRTIHTPVAFLLQTLRNLCLNHLRKDRRLTPLNHDRHQRYEQDSQVRQESEEERGEMEELVIEGLHRLPMKYREVILLNTYSGYTFDEVGEILNVSTEAAWKRASRGRKMIREFIQKEIRKERSKK